MAGQIKGSPQTITADGVIGVEDKPLIVYAVSVDSAATAAVVAFHNGDAATDTMMFQATGTVSKTVLIADIPAGGLYFPAGCFVDIDANTDAVTVWYEQISVV